jgi:hypothetical protein
MLTPDWYTKFQPTKPTINMQPQDSSLTFLPCSNLSSALTQGPNKMHESLLLSSNQTACVASDAIQIAIYVWRGDAKPCSNITGMRYMPNSYFGELWKYLQETTLAHSSQPINLHIISESMSMEPRSHMQTLFESQTLATFKHQLTIKMHLDEPIPTVLSFIIFKADILVTFKSSFSVLPALLISKAMAVYSPYIILPVPYWYKVPQRIQDNAVQSLAAMQKAKCKQENETQM